VGLYDAVHVAAVLVAIVALGVVTVASAWVLVSSISDGDASTAWMGAVVFLMVSLLDIWVFWRMV
jgi:hypothetical protein